MSTSIAKAVMPIIAVESVDQMRDFYVDMLGFDHVMGVVGKDGKFDFCTVVKSGARMMFSRAHGKPAVGKAGFTAQPVSIYFEVPDVVAYHEQLRKKKGVEITDALALQWWGDKTFKVMDPGGYEIWFYQTVGEVKPPEGAKIV